MTSSGEILEGISYGRLYSFIGMIPITTRGNSHYNLYIILIIRIVNDLLFYLVIVLSVKMKAFFDLNKYMRSKII